MIKNMARGFAALSLVLAPLVVPQAAWAAPTAPAAAEVLTLTAAVGQIPVADESRERYERTKFTQWNAGLDLGDGCNTRNEVLLAEEVESPAVAAGCNLSGGRWISYYDGQEVTDPGKLDIDHMVRFAEAWDSGASAWDAKRREAYANAGSPPTPRRTSPATASSTSRGPTPSSRSPCRSVSQWSPWPAATREAPTTSATRPAPIASAPSSTPTPRARLPSSRSPSQRP
ncbi:HNH endonuclease [Streptomyces sp. NPDC101191]|uniref:HNH endonuclease n=1 Tax=Streptomyces sp. NPDC101191 TaxID=3366126 RepID=UPI00380B65E9